MSNNGQPKVGHRYAVGHPYYPPRRLTKRQLRRRVADALSQMIADMAGAHAAGKPVDPQAFTRLVHLQMRMESEL
jgi:hypothetical protein